MLRQVRKSGLEVRAFLRAAVILTCISCTGRFAIALSCQVTHHGTPTEAYTAFLKGDDAKAETLYRAGLAANSADTDLTAGLVYTLLDEQKVGEAADLVTTDLEGSPHSAELLTLRGYVEFQQGVPWTALETANEAAKLDPCNAQTQMLFAFLLSLNSMSASMRDHIAIAHQLDPDNPHFRLSWISTLPPAQRLPELEAFQKEGIPQSDDGLQTLSNLIDDTRRQVADPSKRCHLVTAVKAAEIPYDYRGLEMKLNGHAFSLLFNGYASGIVVNSDTARLAGLEPISKSSPVSGNPKTVKQYGAVVDSIRVGDLEFQNCVVNVADNSSFPGGIVGFAGLGVFSHFLVTMDYPAHKLLLSPLPQRPGKDSAVQRLDTASEAEGQAEDSADPNSDTEMARTTGDKQTERFSDRYIAPEMGDYSKVYRSGPAFILPTQLNGKSIKLFILGPGLSNTVISPQAAADVTKVDDHPLARREGVFVTSTRFAEAEQVTFQFAHISRQLVGVPAIDLSRWSKQARMEISGFIGADLLSGLILHIDFRDGLVKVEKVPTTAHH